MPENPSLSPAAVAGTTRKIVATLPRSRYIAAASVRLSASSACVYYPRPDRITPAVKTAHGGYLTLLSGGSIRCECLC
ncbi:hypothetical protein A671_02853 [Salmonella enterica subsp. enterica serovar Dublin str. DG22]|nr:hypothetical protein A671_02853 [Salmonella enterica subsp. enterica serovar Dublin str. DG22]